MRIEDKIEIACTPPDLWPWLVEPQRILLWMEGVLEQTPASPAPIGIGSRFTTKIREGSKTVAYDSVITEYEPPERLALRMTSAAHSGMAMQIEYRLTPVDEGTRLEYIGEAELRGLYRLMAPAFADVARARMRSCFLRLRSLVGGEAS